ncbi:MAG: sirohydrochlorin chelatase [Myxococcota bacterium]
MESARPSLVIAAHGSRTPGWEERIVEFRDHVAESPGVMDALATVDVAYLEGGAPSIPGAVNGLLEGGCPRVLVAPLFLTASTHLAEDLPGLLGLAVPTHVRRRLKGEGHTPLPPGLPVTLLDLGPLDELLAQNVQRRLSLRAREPSEEAVVLCAYGSSIHHARWEELLGRVGERLVRCGWAWACHAYVGHVVGMSPEPTREAIARAGGVEGVRRVHVVPLLMGVGRLQSEVIASAVRDAGDEARGWRVSYEQDAILPDGDLAAHMGAVALCELGVFPTIDRGATA